MNKMGSVVTKKKEEIFKIPPVRNRDDSSSVLSNALKNRLSEVKMLKRRIAPTTIVVW